MIRSIASAAVLGTLVAAAGLWAVSEIVVAKLDRGVARRARPDGRREARGRKLADL